MSAALTTALNDYRESLSTVPAYDNYIFTSRKNCNRPISRTQAWRIFKRALDAVGVTESVGCNGLRKTFFFNEFETSNGTVAVNLLTQRNHSLSKQSLRYLAENNFKS